MAVIGEQANQLARLGYEMFVISLKRSGIDISLIFPTLPDEYRQAWVDAASAIAKVAVEKPFEREFSSKEQDIGYLIYNMVTLIKDKHRGIYTYSKLSEDIKNSYRNAAKTVAKAVEELEYEI